MNHLKSRLTLGLILVSIISFFPFSTAYATAHVESTLLQQAQEQENLYVIIFVKSPDLNATSAEVKKRFDPEIKSLSGQVREIHRKYLPRRSLSPEEEKEFVRNAPSISQTDQERLKLIHSRLDEKMDDKKKAIGRALKTAASHNLDKVADFVIASGGLVRARIYVISALGVTIPNYFLTDLAGHPLVQAIALDMVAKPQISSSVPTCGFETWWSNGINGAGAYDLGIIDTGVQEDHPAFSSLRFYTDSGIHYDSDPDEGHGTHVTGIVASNGGVDYEDYLGGAYNLDAVVWSISVTAADDMSHMEWQATTAGQSPETINHSFCYDTVTASYHFADAYYDAFISNYEVIVTQAAANAGWSDTSCTLEQPAGAYNVISVANMNAGVDLVRANDSRAWDSSVGPVPGGRKKPDITAPGTAIFSCFKDGSFGELSGTSQAAPHVAAAVILLYQNAVDNPMSQKAILINTADAWTSNNTQSTSDDGPVAGSHWDKSYGWGYMNVDRAYYHRNDCFNDSVIPNNYTSVDDDYKLYKGPMLENEKATLVWQKRVGSVNPLSNIHDLSDLDIILYNEDDPGYYSSAVDGDEDPDENVQQVSAPSNINAVIKVYAVDESFDGVSSEAYALATQE